MLYAPIHDDDCPRRRLSPALGRGRVISTKTAQLIARNLTDRVGPALRVFAASGTVTPELYAELARLYDLRRPDVESWLDALVRYALHHPPGGRSTGSTPGPGEDCR